MLEDIRIKIREEKTQNENLGRIGDYVLDELLTNEEAAAKIGAEGKSLAKCYDDVKAKAKRQAVDGCAVIEDKTVFGWIREYYGITGSGSPSVTAGGNIVDLSEFL